MAKFNVKSAYRNAEMRPDEFNMAFYLDSTKHIIRQLFFIHGLFRNPFPKSFSFVGVFCGFAFSFVFNFERDAINNVLYFVKNYPVKGCIVTKINLYNFRYICSTLMQRKGRQHKRSLRKNLEQERQNLYIVMYLKQKN